LTLDLMKERGMPLSKQEFDWRDMVRVPISKLNDDAFTRVRVILMNGIEAESMRFQHWFARMDSSMRLELARIRRIEQHQQTMVNWLLPPDQSALETTIGYEQVAIEVTASVAQHEPDPYLAQIYRFGLLEDFDHLYRYSALLDRLEGKDANNIIQSYTDIRPGRPTVDEHRHPDDDVREHYDRKTAAPLSKIHALLITGSEQQTHDYYMNVGPTFADPMARQLYAEIASIEEQHVTQYESLSDPGESWMEKWLLHEAMEVYCYYSCVEQEKNTRVKEVWDRLLAQELGHLQHVMGLFRAMKRDPLEILPPSLPQPIEFASHRAFVRRTLEQEIGLRAAGTRIVDGEPPGSKSIAYRARLNSAGSPSETVANGYRWKPGTELVLDHDGNGQQARRAP
jgi:rubrerythrin